MTDDEKERLYDWAKKERIITEAMLHTIISVIITTIAIAITLYLTL